MPPGKYPIEEEALFACRFLRIVCSSWIAASARGLTIRIMQD
jgi:hypothetical protein